MINLSIIIVNFNTKELLAHCLQSIQKSQVDGLEWEIIVVDNASQDGSVERVEQRYKDIKILRNKENLGFAKANNQALRRVYSEQSRGAKGEYILLLNSDTEVKPGALGALVNFAQKNPKAGVVGARLFNPDGTIQSSVYHLPTIWRAIAEYWFGQKGFYEKYAPPATDAISVEAVTGAAMLISRETIEKVGFLDEKYFMYFEDLDYCRRVKKAGLKIYYLPIAEVIHHHGASGREISDKPNQWLIESSKIYNGILKYILLYFVIRLGTKIRKILSIHVK